MWLIMVNDMLFASPTEKRRKFLTELHLQCTHISPLKHYNDKSNLYTTKIYVITHHLVAFIKSNNVQISHNGAK